MRSDRQHPSRLLPPLIAAGNDGDRGIIHSSPADRSSPPGTAKPRVKAPVLYSFSPPITKRVYNLSLNELFAWSAPEPWPGFTKATVAASHVAL